MITYREFSKVIENYGLDERLDNYDLFLELRESLKNSQHEVNLTAQNIVKWLDTWTVLWYVELIAEIKDDIVWSIENAGATEEDCIYTELENRGGFELTTNDDRPISYVFPTEKTSTEIFKTEKD